MIIEDRFVVKADQNAIWNFLLDTESLARCLPGCEEVKNLGDGVYQALVAVQIAFMKMKFNVNVRITEMTPPQQLVSEIEGKPLSMVGQLKVKAKMDLNPMTERETEMSYWMDMSMFGKLGTLGQSAFRSKAKEVGGLFAENIRKALETEEIQKEA